MNPTGDLIAQPRSFGGWTTNVYTRTAPADAPCVVALHSLGLAGDSVGALAMQLPQVRWIAFDQRGHGAAAPAEPTLGTLVADVLAVVAASGESRVHLLGHSLGGAVAAVAASRLGARCASLALVATPPAGGEVFRTRARQLEQAGAAVILTQTLERWFGGAEALAARRARGCPVLAYAQTRLAAMSVQNQASAWRALGDFAGYAALAPSLPPTLAVAGADDLSTPPAAMAGIGQAFADAGMAEACRHTVVADQGHMLVLEPAPALVRALLEHWNIVS